MLINLVSQTNYCAEITTSGTTVHGEPVASSSSMPENYQFKKDRPTAAKSRPTNRPGCGHAKLAKCLCQKTVEEGEVGKEEGEPKEGNKSETAGLKCG